MTGALTDGPPIRRLLSFGLPLVVGSVAHALFNLVDVWLVGRYAPADFPGLPGAGGAREAALSAIHNASVLNFLPMLVANGISVATIASVSRAIGADDARKASHLIGRSLVVCLALGFLLGAVAALTSTLQLRLLATTPEAWEPALGCLRILSWGSITMFALLQVTAIERAAGRSVPPLLLLVGANVLNAGASVLLVPKYGAEGAAWATVASRGLFALLGIGWLFWRPAGGLRPRGFGLAGLVGESADLLRIGIPASLQLFTRALAVILVTGLLAGSTTQEGGSLSDATDATAAYGVALRLEMIAMFACAGFGTAAAAAVGQNLGAGKVRRAIRMGWLAAGLAGVGMVVLGALLYGFAPRLFPFFLEEEHVARLDAIVAYGTEYFRVMAFTYVFVGVGIVLAEGINGAGATRLSFGIDFVSYVVVLRVLAEVLRPEFGLKGLWLALALAHGIAALAYAILFARVLRARGPRDAIS